MMISVVLYIFRVIHETVRHEAAVLFVYTGEREMNGLAFCPRPIIANVLTMIQSSVLSVWLHHRKQHTQREKEEEEKILLHVPDQRNKPCHHAKSVFCLFIWSATGCFPSAGLHLLPHEKLYNRPKLLLHSYSNSVMNNFVESGPVSIWSSFPAAEMMPLYSVCVCAPFGPALD